MSSTWNSYEIYPGMPYTSMVEVEGGSFLLDDRIKCEVSSFYLGQYQVTQALWEQVMGNNPSDFKGDRLPVESISWNDCQKFLEKLNHQLGLTGKELYRLPTEAEWEYAARGGKYARITEFAGSGELKEVGWYDDFFTGEKNAHNWTETSGFRIPNELGLYDMSGNVREWCFDWYGDYSDTSLKNPHGPDSGNARVLRGGSWFNVAVNCRVASRYSNHPDNRDFIYGLRLARTSLRPLWWGVSPLSRRTLTFWF